MVCSNNPLTIQNELAILLNKYKGRIISSEEAPTEIVFKPKDKHIFAYHLTTMTNGSDSGILLSSFNQIEKLNLLTSLGLPPEEIKEILIHE